MIDERLGELCGFIDDFPSAQAVFAAFTKIFVVWSKVRKNATIGTYASRHFGRYIVFDLGSQLDRTDITAAVVWLLSRSG